jgi:hypothetical protein
MQKLHVHHQKTAFGTRLPLYPVHLQFESIPSFSSDILQDVVGDWVSQELQLRAVGRDGDLGALKPVVQAEVTATRQVGG